MRGIEEIGLRLSIRIEAKESVERLDETYLKNLVNWQLDQYRIKVAQGNPGLPFLSVRIRVERVPGPGLARRKVLMNPRRLRSRLRMRLCCSFSRLSARLLLSRRKVGAQNS